MTGTAHDADKEEGIYTMACPLCAGRQISPWCRKNDYDIYRCNACGVGFMCPSSVASINATALYSEAYYHGNDGRTYPDYTFERSCIQQNAQSVLRWIESGVSIGTLLEVGSAEGYFLETARDRGWRVAGVEISEYASGVARARGLDVQNTDFLSSVVSAPLESVDVFVSLDTIEHVTDPVGMVSKVSVLLKKGGVAVLSTGDAGSIFARLSGERWRLIEPPEHMFYFTKHSISLLLEDWGMEVIGFRKPWRWYTLNSLLSVLRVKLPTCAGRCAVPLNLFDVMYVMARKV